MPDKRVERMKSMIALNEVQCGVGSVLEHKQYEEAVHNRNFVISWILQGEGTYREGNTEYSLADGCVCLRRPGREYTMTLLKRDGIRLYLTIPQDIYPAMVWMVPEIEEIPPVWNCPFDRDLMDSFCSLYDRLSQISSLELHTVFPQMIQYILQLTGIQQRRENDPLTLGRRLLEENRTLSLEEIAFRCGMKYNTFRKRFAEQFGISPGQYRIRQRVQAACHLLAEGRSVGEVAMSLGYTDIYSFTHQFRAETGIPPSHYRKENF